MLIKLSFSKEEEINTFSQKGKLKDFVPGRITLKEMLKESF